MLNGELVTLRAMEPADNDALWRWNSDPEVVRWLQAGYPESLAQIRDRGAARPRNSYGDVLLVIQPHDLDRAVGIVRLHGAEPETGRAELDVYIGEPDLWGRGYGTDAMRVICRYGFERMRLHSIALWVVAENEAARHVYEKVGFRVDGRHRDCFRGAGRWHDMFLMSLIDGELSE